jgi:hypothetical protein
MTTIEKLVFVTTNVLNALTKLGSNTPQDISIDYVKDDGTIEKSIFPNIKKFQDSLPGNLINGVTQLQGYATNGTHTIYQGDLNDLTTNGTVLAYDNCINSPVGHSFGFTETSVHMKGSWGTQTFTDMHTFEVLKRQRDGNGIFTEWKKFYSTANTTVDANGFIKEASPIINIFTDDFQLFGFENYKIKPIVRKISKGIYEIKNTQGISSNGWYIETPKNRNGSVYFNVDYTQNIKQPINKIKTPISDIVITLKVYERVWNPTSGVHENGVLIDINDLQNRYIAMRFNDIENEEYITIVN